MIYFRTHLEFQAYFKQLLLKGGEYINEARPQQIHNVMSDISLYVYWLYRSKQTTNNSIYDYMYFLRKERAKVLPKCTYKVKRRKTPQYQHGFTSNPYSFLHKEPQRYWLVRNALLGLKRGLK